jgi:hypothetical protein
MVSRARPPKAGRFAFWEDRMIGALVHLLIYLLVIGIVVWLVLYILSIIPLPEPFGRVARIIVMVVACLIVIMLLLGLIDGGPSLRLR